MTGVGDRVFYIGPQPGSENHGSKHDVAPMVAYKERVVFHQGGAAQPSRTIIEDVAIGSSGKVRGQERGVFYVDWGEGFCTWVPKIYLASWSNFEKLGKPGWEGD